MAACRGGVGGPGLYSCPGPGRSTSETGGREEVGAHPRGRLTTRTEWGVVQTAAARRAIDHTGRRSDRYSLRDDDQTLQRWICESCGYIYDPEEGDPDGGIPAGTAFEDIPDTWFCPVCGARKRDFTLYED